MVLNTADTRQQRDRLEALCENVAAAWTRACEAQSRAPASPWRDPWSLPNDQRPKETDAHAPQRRTRLEQRPGGRS